MSDKLLLIFCLIIGVQSIPDISPCKKDDAACQTKNINALYKASLRGDPDLGIENLDPMFHEVVDADLGTLKYTLTKSTVEGMSNCEVTDTKVELEKSKATLHMVCPLITMHGLYDISGNLLGMPIKGNGDFRLECKGYDIQLDTEIKVNTSEDGKKHFSFKSFKAHGELQGGMTAKLNNLFNGEQKELADNVHKFINTNWKVTANLLQGPVFNANVKKIIKNFNKNLKIIPVDQFFLNM